MRRKSTLAITLAAAMAATAVPAMADDKVSITIFNSKMEVQSEFDARLPFVLRVPWEASVTLLEATTPVKLPTKRCPLNRVRIQIHKGQYFNGDSTIPGGTASQSPAYPTHHAPKFSVKLQ